MEHFPEDFIKPLLISFDTLEQSNIQILNGSAWKKLSFLYIIPLALIFNISTCCYVIQMFSTDAPLLEIAFMVSTLLIMIQAIIKAVLVLPKKTKITKLIENLGNNWRRENMNERQIRKKESILRRLHLCLKVFYWGSIITAWNILLAPAQIMLWRMIVGQGTKFLLPFGFVLPFDPFENWFTYIMVYAFQVYSLFRFVYIYIGTEILMVTLCALLTVEFVVLRDDFESIQPNVVQTNGFTIQDLIIKHQLLLLFNKLLNDIFNKMLFSDLLFISVIMCFFGFGATVAQNTLEAVNNFFAVLALLLPAFIFCYYSEQLKEESAAIADAAYANKWYKGNASYQKINSFVMKRSQKSCCLMSLGYVPVSLNTFSKLVSTSWSYFSLIRSVYNDD